MDEDPFSKYSLSDISAAHDNHEAACRLVEKNLINFNKAFEEIEEITADLEKEDAIDDWAMRVALGFRSLLNS